jgi:hypothetical protein
MAIAIALRIEFARGILNSLLLNIFEESDRGGNQTQKASLTQMIKYDRGFTTTFQRRFVSLTIRTGLGTVSFYLKGATKQEKHLQKSG